MNWQQNLRWLVSRELVRISRRIRGFKDRVGFHLRYHWWTIVQVPIALSGLFFIGKTYHEPDDVLAYFGVIVPAAEIWLWYLLNVRAELVPLGEPYPMTFLSRQAANLIDLKEGGLILSDSSVNSLLASMSNEIETIEQQYALPDTVSKYTLSVFHNKPVKLRTINELKGRLED